MKTTAQWVAHFKENAQQQRINWNQTPSVTPQETKKILRSLQAWQLGETSEGKDLLQAAGKYATAQNDPYYLQAIELFIREEQKHGNNLGRYLDAIGAPRLKKDWGDSLFRRVRHLYTNMEIWTLAVTVVESAAQIYYQALKDATGCTLLKQICTDILVDEAWHIDFQTERLHIIYKSKSAFVRALTRWIYYIFYFTTANVVWLGHGSLFKAGNVNYTKYMYKMRFKYNRIIRRVTFSPDVLFYKKLILYPHAN